MPTGTWQLGRASEKADLAVLCELRVTTQGCRVLAVTGPLILITHHPPSAPGPRMPLCLA